MRIAVVGNFGLGYKGTMAARALPLAEQLAGRGHTVAVIVPRDRPPVARATNRVRIVRLGRAGDEPNRSSGWLTLLGHLWLGLQITGRAFWFRPDVLFAFKPKAYAGLALLLFWGLRRLRLSRVVLALDADDWEGAGGWADRDGSPTWQRWLVTWHERWCLRHADVVTVASQELRHRASAERNSVVYAPNAASPALPGWRQGDRQVIRTALGLDREPIVLAYTRFVEFRPVRLLDTFDAIVQEVPEARLLVAGEGLAGEERELAHLAAARGLISRVHVLGWVPPADLPDVLAAADVAVYPMDDTLLNRAKCPMKLLDLLLAGVPVVAEAVGQVCEYIVDGENGRLTPPGNSGALAAAAVDLLRDAATRHQIAAAARTRIFSAWTWERQAQLIEAALGAARSAAIKE